MAGAATVVKAVSSSLNEAVPSPFRKCEYKQTECQLLRVKPRRHKISPTKLADKSAYGLDSSTLGLHSISSLYLYK